MIKIMYQHGRACTIVNCDICGDMIGDYHDGAVVFGDGSGRSANEKVDVLHAHKGQCHDAAEGRFDSGQCGWHELGYHLIRLCTNTGIDDELFRELRESADRLDSI